MSKSIALFLFYAFLRTTLGAQETPSPKPEEARALRACAKAVLAGFLKVADTRDERAAARG